MLLWKTHVWVQQGPRTPDIPPAKNKQLNVVTINLGTTWRITRKKRGCLQFSENSRLRVRLCMRRGRGNRSTGFPTTPMRMTTSPLMQKSSQILWKLQPFHRCTGLLSFPWHLPPRKATHTLKRGGLDVQYFEALIWWTKSNSNQVRFELEGTPRG